MIGERLQTHGTCGLDHFIQTTINFRRGTEGWGGSGGRIDVAREMGEPFGRSTGEVRERGKA